MDFEAHLHILRELRIPYKGALIRILWHIYKEHGKEIKDIEKDVISKIYPPRKPYVKGTPRPQRPQTETMKLCLSCKRIYPFKEPDCPDCGTKAYRKVILQ